ncbi:MAG: hypothetical protein AVDCRST_MAG27-3799, partial [uncultured Craurococcus sp.]
EAPRRPRPAAAGRSLGAVAGLAAEAAGRAAAPRQGDGPRLRPPCPGRAGDAVRHARRPGRCLQCQAAGRGAGRRRFPRGARQPPRRGLPAGVPRLDVRQCAGRQHARAPGLRPPGPRLQI